MKLSLLPSLILLGAATAKQPVIFGRSTAIDKAKALKKTAKTYKYGAPKTSKGYDSSSIIQRSVPSAKASKAYSLFKRTILSNPSSAVHNNKKSKSSKTKSKASRGPIRIRIDESSSMSYGTVNLLPKSGKATGNVDYLSESTSMSYGNVDLFPASSKAGKTTFQDILDYGSMSFSYSYDDVPATAPPSDTVPDDNFGRVIFDYLSTCAGVELDTDSCLVSKTIDAFMSMGGSARLRSLQASNVNNNGRLLQAPVNEEECAAPDISADDLTALMGSAKEECDGYLRPFATSAEPPQADEEFATVQSAFMNIIASTECWESLCTEDFSKLFFTILFDDAASCVGVDFDVPECVKDHIIDRVLLFEDPTADGVRRRVLQESEDPCDTPSTSDLSFFTQFLLIEADAICSTPEAPLDVNWDKAREDLVAIFSSSECWGNDECIEDDSSISLDTPFNRYVVTDDGHQCIFESDTDADQERDLTLSYYYLIETTSSEAPDLELILAGIEGKMIELACDDTSSRRRRLDEYQPVVVAVDSTPADVVSADYTCTAANPEANGCYIVQGQATLTVEGNSTEYDDVIIAEAYTKIEELFDFLPIVLDDESIVEVDYLGKEMPSTSIIGGGSTRPTITQINKSEEGTSSINTALIASAGGLVAMALLITGFRRMNKDKDAATRHEVLDDKSADGSTGGSKQTADLTCAHSCDLSLSSVASPVGSLNSNSIGSPAVRDMSTEEVAKFFILAEECDEEWRELSILPELAQDDGTLENVSEEESYIGNVSCSSSQASI